MFEHFECVKVDLRDGIAWVRMNRPEKRNAMNPQLHNEMEEALTHLEVDPDAKVIVICGAGGNFSAGQDLKMFFRENEKNPLGRKTSQRAANRWRWELLYSYDKPTIAMVEGYCVGGAFMQLLATDFALAAEDAVEQAGRAEKRGVLLLAEKPARRVILTLLGLDGEGEGGGRARVRPK